MFFFLSIDSTTNIGEFKKHFGFAYPLRDVDLFGSRILFVAQFFALGGGFTTRSRFFSRLYSTDLSEGSEALALTEDCTSSVGRCGENGDVKYIHVTLGGAVEFGYVFANKRAIYSLASALSSTPTLIADLSGADDRIGLKFGLRCFDDKHVLFSGRLASSDCAIRCDFCFCFSFFISNDYPILIVIFFLQ